MSTTSIGGTYNQIGRDQFNYSLQHPIFPVPVASSSDNPLPLRPFINVPADILTIHFTGRTDELTRIKEILDAVGGDVPIRCVIHGMHGIGKSQLTLYFAISAFDQQRYLYVLWISATTIAKLQQGFDKLLDLIDHKDRSHPQQETRLTAARRWLEECQGKWLLILDNVEPDTLEFLREHLPHRNKNGNIIFTTRTESLADSLANSAGQRHQMLDLRIPNIDDAAKLLLDHSEGEPDKTRANSAKDVVKCVGCLPLAVAQAGSFMKQSGKSLDEMLNLYHSNRKIELIYWENNLSNYEAKSVAATFSHQLQDLAHQHPIASNLVNILAFMDPESISLSIITQGAETVKMPLSHQIMKRISKSPDFKPLLSLVQSPVELQKAITQLQSRSLVRLHHRDSETPTLNMHDLVHFMIQEDVKRSGFGNHWFELTVQLVCGALGRLKYPDSPGDWVQWEAFVSHIRSLTKRLETQTVGKKIWSLLIKANELIADYMVDRGRYKDCQPILDDVLAWKEKNLGMRHLDTISTLFRLARASWFQGHYKNAEALYERVRATLEKKRGAEYYDTLLAANNVAVACRSQGRYEDAERLHKQVLAIQEKKMGVDHHHTLVSMHCLALVYHLQGRHNEAETLYERVLVGRQKIFGADHPETLWIMDNLGCMYQSQNRYRDAEDMHKRVLASREEQFGVEHPITLGSVRHLALAYGSQGRHSDAVILYERALAGQNKFLGAEHPDTLSTVDNLLYVYEVLDQHEDAEMMRGWRERVGIGEGVSQTS